MPKSIRLVRHHQGELRVLGIGDTHFPFVNEKKLQEIYKVAKDLKPTHVIQVGDLFDMYSFSRFSRSLNLITPKDEMERARKMTVQMWKDISRICPGADKYQLLGNHSLRIWTKIMANAPEYEDLLTEPIQRLFKFDGVTSMPDSRSELELNGIVFNHGWKSSIGDHARWYGQNTVCGHLHRGGVAFFPMKGKAMWELNCGFIADTEQLPLEYGDTKTNSWVAGVGVIDKYGPRFINL